MDFTKEMNEWKENVTPIKTAKFLAGTVISCGAMAAVVAAFKNPISSAKGISKLMMRLGVFILGCKAGDMAEKYFNDAVDDLLKVFNEAKEEVKNEPNSNEQ